MTLEQLKNLFLRELRTRINHNIFLDIKEESDSTKTVTVLYAHKYKFSLQNDELPTHQSIHNMAGRFITDLHNQANQLSELYEAHASGFDHIGCGRMKNS